MELRSDREIELIDHLTTACRLDFKKVTEAQRSTLLRLLEQSARAMRVDPVLPDFPKEGFLENPLNDVQREAIDRGLGSLYREEAIQLQSGLKGIRIEECGEPLEDLKLRFERERLHAVFCTDPYRPDAQAIPRTFWGRVGFVDRLVTMVRGFNEIDVRPYLHDLFRAPGAQEGLYTGAYDLVKMRMGLSGKALEETVKALVAYCPAIAAHKGAAAADIFLQDKEGHFLDLGNSFVHPGPGAAIKFPFVTPDQYRTRQLYACIASMAGCTVYPFEDWHASFGDAFAALGRGDSICRYGPIEGFDTSTGAVLPSPPEKYWEEFSRPVKG